MSNEATDILTGGLVEISDLASKPKVYRVPFVSSVKHKNNGRKHLKLALAGVVVAFLAFSFFLYAHHKSPIKPDITKSETDDLTTLLGASDDDIDEGVTGQITRMSPESDKQNGSSKQNLLGIIGKY